MHYNNYRDITNATYLSLYVLFLIISVDSMAEISACLTTNQKVAGSIPGTFIILKED